jgi:hypothetical protein
MTHEEALRKAMSCLRLAERAGTPDEAAVAAAKAQKIIDDYKLDISNLEFDSEQLKEDKEEVKDFGYADPLDDVKYGNYRESWTLRLASIVAHHNQCAIRYQKKQDKGIRIRAVGRPSDVQALRYLYSFFRRQIEELTAQNCKGNSSTFKGEFCVGCIETLSKKLDEQAEATVTEVKERYAGDEKALVRVNQAVSRLEKRKEDVDDFFNKYIYEAYAEQLGISIEVARLLYRCRYTQLKALLGDEKYKEVKDAYEAYQAEERKRLKGLRLGRGSRGFDGAGARTTTGGREAGRKAGESIRMTGAKAGIGAGRKSIE